MSALTGSLSATSACSPRAKSPRRTRTRSGCHNAPYAIPGGSGDITTVGFELADRFDFVTFDRKDAGITTGSVDEVKRPVFLTTVGNQRATPDLFGAGYLEMIARQMTRDLQSIRDSIQPGRSARLVSKGVSFGTLTRAKDGRWDARAVEGLPRPSVMVGTAAAKPTLIVLPWQRAGNTVSLRDITNTSLNQHLGIQTTERFGVNTDPDGDGVVNEVTRGDVTLSWRFKPRCRCPAASLRAILKLRRRWHRASACSIASVAADVTCRACFLINEAGCTPSLVPTIQRAALKGCATPARAICSALLRPF